MRSARLSVVLAVLLVSATPAAHAQTTTIPPLEDVTLRGRVLTADGSPVANAPLRVDAVNDDGITAVGFFSTLGFSLLTCFAPDAPDRELCPVPRGKRFNSTTDDKGNYSLTFKNAHRRGIQTNTDYVFSIGAPSQSSPDAFVIGSYELELQDPVHNAPDLRLWDPPVKLSPRQRSYAISYPRRAQSKNGMQVYFGDKLAPVKVGDNGEIDARDVEDQNFSVVATASKDEAANATIYHQRFTAAPVTRKANLVPLSRNVACTATRVDGTTTHCGYTDGDLVTPGVVDANPCVFPSDTQCQPRVTKITVDLGAAKDVGDVRTRCACQVQGSSDGATFHGLPTGSFGKQSLRYITVTGDSLAAVPEISVWPPWPPGEGIDLLPRSLTRGLPGGSGEDGRSWLLAFVAVAALAVAGGLLLRQRRDVTEVGRPR